MTIVRDGPREGVTIEQVMDAIQPRRSYTVISGLLALMCRDWDIKRVGRGLYSGVDCSR